MRVWLLKGAAPQPAHGCAEMPGLHPCREQTHRGAILTVYWPNKNLKKGETHNYGCVNCHHLPTMLPTVGRDERDALVPPGAEAGNGTSLPCIIGACHVGVIIALIIDNFILFNALKHLNTYKCRDSVFKIKPEAVWWR